MRKKLDSRVRTLVENAVAQRHRAFFVMIGDRGKDQVVNLHYMLSKITTTNPSVLWCYKTELGFSSHRKKRIKQLKKKIQGGLFDPNIDDPFELFVSSTRIRYCYYKESHLVLGQTFSMCILQDFEALTPNILCRTIETVQGGGIVCILLRTMSSLKQLYDLSMDLHSRFNSVGASCRGDVVKPRFNERLILSLADCKNCLVVDDEMNILPISKHSTTIVSVHDALSSIPVATAVARKSSPHSNDFTLLGDSGEPALLDLKERLAMNPSIGPLVNMAVTLDQANVLLSFVDTISSKTLNTTLALTAGRGRGKSATLGLAVAAAIAYSYSNIFVTAPAPENVSTLFEFVQKLTSQSLPRNSSNLDIAIVCSVFRRAKAQSYFQGLLALGYVPHTDFELVQGEVVAADNSTSKHLVRINVYREHRQAVQYITPSDVSFARQSEILVVDEAAAIPLSVINKLFGPYYVFLASTVNGYEGTGRALSLKLLKEIKTKSIEGGAITAASGRHMTELTLDTPIRYGRGDPLEAWLNSLLCLDCPAGPAELRVKNLPLPSSCQLYEVNRDALFSYHEVSEILLNSIMGLFVASHYKNSPNDLFLLSDAPSHQIFVLVPSIEDDAENMTDVFVAVQVALEGSISKEAIRSSLQQGSRPSGDLIPWCLSQTYIDEDFGSLTGARIVRIAVHPTLQKMGYGSEALRQLFAYFEGSLSGISRAIIDGKEITTEADNNCSRVGEENSLLLEVPIARTCPALLKPCCSGSPPVSVDYIGTCFGVTTDLFKFYARLGLAPVYLRQSENETTGEHSIIMIKALGSGTADWVGSFMNDFRSRLLNLLGSVFSNIPTCLALSLVATTTKCAVSEDNPTAPPIFPAVDSSTIGHFLTRHDILRLERYTEQRLDRHLVLDLLPILARLIFTSRFPQVVLSPLQSAVLLGMGCQRKTPESIAKEFDVPTSQVLALFSKALHRIHAEIHKLLEQDVLEKEEDNHQHVLEVPQELPEMSLREELEACATKKLLTDKRLQIYSTEKITENIDQVLKGKIPSGTVSVKVKRQMPTSDSNAHGFSIQQKFKKAKKK